MAPGFTWTAAIWIPDYCRIPVEEHGLDWGWVTKSGGVTYFSCYFTANESTLDFIVILEGPEGEVLKTVGA